MAWREETKVPLIRISKSIPQICIQVVKRNVLITGECCTHRSQYFSIFFLYRNFCNKPFSWVRVPTSSTDLKVFQCINAIETLK